MLLRTVVLLFFLVLSGFVRGEGGEPMLLEARAQGKTMDQAVAALTQAVVNHNYTFVRQQAIDARLVPYVKEIRSVRLVYFCNFAKMDRALRTTPLASQVLPCRVTLLETPEGVDLLAVNPAWASQNTPELHEQCLELKQDYQAILEEAAL